MITLGTWILITAVCTFSAMTGAQFIGAHSPWPWSGWILAAGIDAAFVMALQADAALARCGTTGGPWPTAFRWTTGACSVFVNTGDAALRHDPVGITIHLIAPILLLVLGEAGPAWRRELTNFEPPTTVVTNRSPTTPDPTRPRPGSTSANPEGADQPAQFRPHPVTIYAEHPTASAPDALPVTSTPEVGTPRTAFGDLVRTPPSDGGTHAPNDADEARARILQGRLNGLSQRETARLAHRSPSFVRKVWTSLPEQEPATAPPNP
ncbi:helix-turn-helix domain-containing protein [Kitasatospora sp. LaBMicrA B282]|uniref:helix-turn-helix domain-containing protein n=1 Tax=Kitasatospora sp. LaBMicrA B282 TaxID=3420949 RepID=UPI003D0AF62F